MQHSSVHLGGLFLVHLLTFGSALVVAHYLGPAEFGRFGLLLFFASLITLLFKIATKRGTYMQVFGGDDEDDDDDEEDISTVGDRDRILGNGIFLSLAARGRRHRDRVAALGRRSPTFSSATTPTAC